MTRLNCQKGKSCGATCIESRKICRVELGNGSDLAKVAAEVQSRVESPSSQSAKVDGLISELEREVNAKNVDRVKELRDKSLEEARKLPDTERRAKIDKIDDALKTVTMDHRKNTAEEFKEAGKVTMDKYRGRIQSILDNLSANKAEKREISKELDKAGLSRGERKELEKEHMRLSKESIKLGAKLGEIMGEIREEMLVPTVPQYVIDKAISRVMVGGFGVNGDRQVLDNLKEFARMFNGRGLGDEPAVGGENKGIRLTTVSRTPEANPRAHANTKLGLVRLNEPNFQKTAFHEFAHIIESQNPSVLRYAESWRNGRAFSAEQIPSERPGLAMASVPSGQSVVRLKEMAPNLNYGPNEVGMLDRYIDPYMGRYYPKTSSMPPSTEVISVGVQHFSSVNDMVRLYRSHPDLFEFVVGMATST